MRAFPILPVCFALLIGATTPGRGDSAPARAKPPAGKATPSARPGAAVSVREFGARGDGKTDDTRAIQAAINAARAPHWQEAHGKTVFFPPGVYKISRKLTVDAAQIAFVGAHRNRSIIRQHTANTPIFYWPSELGGTAHSIAFRHLGLIFNDKPATTATQQWAIQFRANPEGTLATGNGFYLCEFDDLWIENAYIGIGGYSTGKGLCPIWSSDFRRIVFSNTRHHAIKLSSAGDAGQPHNTISHVDVLNYDPKMINDGPAILGVACSGLVIDHLNVEDWHDTILSFYGGTYLTVNGLRTERHDLTGDYPIAVYCANGQFIFNGVDFTLLRTHHTGHARLFQVEGDARLVVNGVAVERAPQFSTTDKPVAVLSGDGSARIVANALRLMGGALEYLPSSYGAGLYARVSVDGLPPRVDALPPASAVYRGRSFSVEGGSGTADAVYRCEKTAADVYVWKER